MQRKRSGTLKNRSYISWIYLDVSLCVKKPQDRHTGNMELTFVCFNKELMVNEALENQTDVVNVCLLTREKMRISSK